MQDIIQYLLDDYKDDYEILLHFDIYTLLVGNCIIRNFKQRLEEASVLMTIKDVYPLLLVFIIMFYFVVIFLFKFTY